MLRAAAAASRPREQGRRSCGVPLRGARGEAAAGAHHHRARTRGGAAAAGDAPARQRSSRQRSSARRRLIHSRRPRRARMRGNAGAAARGMRATSAGCMRAGESRRERTGGRPAARAAPPGGGCRSSARRSAWLRTAGERGPLSARRGRLRAGVCSDEVFATAGGWNDRMGDVARVTPRPLRPRAACTRRVRARRRSAERAAGRRTAPPFLGATAAAPRAPPAMFECRCGFTAGTAGAPLPQARHEGPEAEACCRAPSRAPPRRSGFLPPRDRPRLRRRRRRRGAAAPRARRRAVWALSA